MSHFECRMLRNCVGRTQLVVDAKILVSVSSAIISEETRWSFFSLFFFFFLVHSVFLCIRHFLWSWSSLASLSYPPHTMPSCGAGSSRLPLVATITAGGPSHWATEVMTFFFCTPSFVSLFFFYTQVSHWQHGFRFRSASLILSSLSVEYSLLNSYNRDLLAALYRRFKQCREVSRASCRGGWKLPFKSARYVWTQTFSTTLFVSTQLSSSSL